MYATTPLTIGRALDAGFRLYRDSFKHTLPVALVASVILTISQWIMMENVDHQALAAGDTNAVVAYLGVMCVQLFGFMAFIGMISHSTHAFALGDPQPPLPSIKRGLWLAFPLTVVMILYFLILSLGLVLLIIPGVIVTVSMCLFGIVPFAENRGCWGALWRSHVLVWNGNWWRTAVYLTIVTIVTVALTSLVSLLTGFIQGFDALLEPDAPPPLLSYLVGLVVAVFLYPALCAIGLVWYRDLLVRREGADLDSRLTELEQS